MKHSPVRTARKRQPNDNDAPLKFGRYIVHFLESQIVVSDDTTSAKMRKISKHYGMKVVREEGELHV